jgi:hypothetical protein
MSIGVLRGTVVALASAVVISVSPLAAEPVALRGYNAAIGETSISGISSGAFMAVQFATAWSSVIKGVGVIAGGPCWCADRVARGEAWSNLTASRFFCACVMLRRRRNKGIV